VLVGDDAIGAHHERHARRDRDRLAFRDHSFAIEYARHRERERRCAGRVPARPTVEAAAPSAFVRPLALDDELHRAMDDPSEPR